MRNMFRLTASAAVAFVQKAFGTKKEVKIYHPALVPRSSGRVYPEQSSRQALRAFRRAQGGPGISLVVTPLGASYQPRNVA